MSSEFQTETILFDKELHELATLRRERGLLEHLAKMFEYLGGRCQGECTTPLRVANVELTRESITCCDLRPAFERYHDVCGLEMALDEKIRSRE